MALSIVNMPNAEGFKGVAGVYADQATPILLGHQDDCALFTIENTEDTIAVGLDRTVNPTRVKVYFGRGEGNMSEEAPDKRYGLLMTCQYSFDRLAVLPSIISPSLEYQDSYGAQDWRPLGSCFVMNMMSPHLLSNAGIEDPFYANNAISLGSNESVLQTINGPNGFFTMHDRTGAANEPLCAALIAPIGIDVDMPLLGEIGRNMAQKPHFRNKPPDFVEVSSIPKATGIDLNGNLLGQIIHHFGVSASDVVSNQLIDNAFLVTFSDPENYQQIAYLDLNSANLYAIDPNEMSRLSWITNSNLFERVYNALTINVANDQLPTHAGITTRSYNTDEKRRTQTMLSGGDHEIGYICKIYCISEDTEIHDSNSIKKRECLGGVQLSLRRSFDKDSLSFGGLIKDDENGSSIQLLAREDILNCDMEFGKIYDKELRGKRSKHVGGMPELRSFYSTLRGHSNLAGDMNEKQWFTTQPAWAGS